MNPLKIWNEFESGKNYKTALNLYETVKLNQEFYNGNQWEGVNAPSIEKPVINLLRQAVDYYVSMIVSDDIAVLMDIGETADQQLKKVFEYIASNGINEVFESTKFREQTRYFIKNAAIDGDAFFHWHYNMDKNPDGRYKGAIDLELIDSTNIIFGNPAEFEVQKQPYIIVVQKLPLDEVQKLTDEEITADSQEYNTAEMNAQAVGKYVTVLTKFWKKDNEIHWMRTTKEVELVPDTNLETRLYPFAKMGWKRVKNSYHSISPLTEARTNQIMINKYYMMLNEFVKKLSFPKVLYDGNVIKEWSNKVEAIKVNGIPNQAFAVSSPTVQLSSQFVQFADNLIDKTKTTLGIYDVALGNARPENTSAIVALQKTASQPLELQRLDYVQVVEDCVRIIVDLMSTQYGKRNVIISDGANTGEIEFDYADLNAEEFTMNVEVGQASYWSEITQIQTADNLFKLQVIDAKTYVEILPPGTLPKKDLILESINAKQEFLNQQAAMMQQQAPQPPVV